MRDGILCLDDIGILSLDDLMRLVPAVPRQECTPSREWVDSLWGLQDYLAIVATWLDRDGVDMTSDDIHDGVAHILDYVSAQVARLLAAITRDDA